jgi:hypothetical protein
MTALPFCTRSRPTPASLWTRHRRERIGQVMIATSVNGYFSSDSARGNWGIGHNVMRPNRIGTFTIGGGS